ncbi:SDR family NAD(P)-dependent oxidoreductase [Syntrophomonas curvata]
MNEMDMILCKLLWGQLQSMGMFLKEDMVTVDSIATAGIRFTYARWFEESLAVLSRNAYLRYDGQSYRVLDSDPKDMDAAWDEWNRRKGRWSKDSGLKARVTLLEATVQALPEILKGRVLATDILFPNSSTELVEGIYKNNDVSDFYNEILADTVVAYLKERLEDGPGERIRILEIGAGTGGTSAMVFRKLKPFQGSIEEYCYSDLSRAFLIHGEKEYGSENPYLTYKILNIEMPIAEQGIAEGGFDIVIAANVLHATQYIRQTLRNAKAALKPNGLILLNELNNNSLFYHLTFGLLDGWWLYKDPELRIPGCPALYPETWQTVLENEGFRSVFFPAWEAHHLGQQIVVAESDGVVRQRSRISPSASSVASASARDYHSSPGQNRPPIARDYQPTPANGYTTDRMIGDQVRATIRESIAEALKMEESSIRDSISFSEYGIDSIVAVNLVNLINKLCGLTLKTTVMFDYNNVDRLVDHLVSEYKPELSKLFSENTACSTEDKNKVYATRATQNNRLRKSRKNWGVKAETAYREPITGKNQPSYYRVCIERPGTVDDLKLLESPVPELKDNEVRIAVCAFSINFGDSLCVKGLYPTMPPYPFTPGFEASGIVADVGRDVISVKPGDEVIALMGEPLGGQANMVTCAEEQVMQKPGELSFEEACALPIAAITVIDAFHKANMKKGEKILIQTAAGGIGIIAVQLAQYYGTEIYATAGSQRKLDYLGELGVPHLINYQESDFEKEIKRLTRGQGVDVVINTLPGDAIQKGMNCLSRGGRYIELAMTALKSARTIDISVLNNNQVFYSVDIRKLILDDYGKIQTYLKEMLDMAADKIIHPTIHKAFPLYEIKEAYRCMESRESIGKIVVSIPETYKYRDLTREDYKPGLRMAGVNTAIQQEPIAIIGMSGQFPQSRSLVEFWTHLANGTELTGEVTRWDLTEYYAEGSAYCRHGSFLDYIDEFDARFFNISALEATYMDPQQRVFLEQSWHALEDAGYAGKGTKGRKCGVYVGYVGGDYHKLFEDNPPAQAFWGNSGSVIPARIAYYLDLKGPAIAVDTACSSSLVAVHLACQSLWNKETEMALAGGIFIQSTPEFYLKCNRAGMLSPSGHCHTFDDKADGFVPGEGAGVVVLKRLKEAITDGDHIYGVVRGTAINQDGNTNGITAPSALSQERLECSVYDDFNIKPEEIQMVEAHGTGTKLGDPIEYQALTRAFRKYTHKEEYCAIGSVKTNIGHAAAAAGIAGLIKILLSLQHKQIPPTLNFQSGNTNIQFEKSPFYVNTSLKDWKPGPNGKRCAVVSSFGFSGTNAHMVIEESPQLERQHAQRPGYMIVLSALSSEQLRRQVEQLVMFCEQESSVDCGDMSYTLLLGRKHHKHRLACVVRNQQELVKLFNRWLEKGQVAQVHVSEVHENSRREQPSLAKFGNECILNCQKADIENYLENLSAIVELYVQGYELEYDQLFQNQQYSRIPLPAYPFARERYWVSGTENTGERQTGASKSIASGCPTKNESYDKIISLPENACVDIRKAQERIITNYSDVASIELEVSETTEEMEEFLHRLLWGQLQSLGLFTDNCSENFEDTPLRSMFRGWFEESRAALAREGYLRYDGAIYTVTDTMPVNIDDLWQEWDRKKALWLKSPDMTAKVVLVEATMRALPEILTGKRMATDIMFPKSSMVLIEGIYKNNIVADYFNGMLADMVVSYVRERVADDPSQRIRILEIGAGTGGTSAMVLQKLRAYQGCIEEYCYTDISRAFLLYAEKEYGKENPYLSYKILNVEKPVDEQDIDIGAYDIVIAANVLHATQIIGQTLRNVKALLKKNGWLLLNEISCNTIFNHLTFGLLEGWWFYKDNTLRIPGCPGLSSGTWQMVLENEGFRSVSSLIPESHGLGQQILACESDGIIKHKQQVQTATMSASEARRPSLGSRSGKQPAKPAGEIKVGLLREKSVAFFKKTVGGVLKIPINMIDPAEPLEVYGIDSIFIVQLNDALRDVFGDISNTLFFEYQTIDALTDHFLATQRDALIAYLGLDGNKPSADYPLADANDSSEVLAVYPQHKIRKQESPSVSGNGRNHFPADYLQEPIAIIGMTGRFPKARNMHEFWRILESGTDCITEIPEERWPMEGFFHPDPDEAVALARSYCKQGGFIDGFADFDPLFFNLSPREVFDMDPQERLFIESCWSVLEDAGYTREQLAKQYNGRIGVFTGITKTGFDLYGPELWKKGEQIFPHTQFASVPNRISYLFNLKGPSIPYDTMCSSSLTAIHEACEHLRHGECEMAIAGGVNLSLHPTNYTYLCSMRMLSPDGRCKSFGKGANGYGSGEGVGAVLLKRLLQAIEDQDQIYAVIKGSSINHGGKTNGYKVPNPIAQGELIRSSLDKAGVNARAVSYIEAHGTGTELGDPIEVTGLTQAFGRDTKDKGFCALGSVKSNIGHAEAAAGIAGVAKIVLQMKHRQIAPSLHASELNPLINFAETPFIVQQELGEWKRPVINGREMPRAAGISSFGAGGSNAHVVIEEYIPRDPERATIAITPQNPAIIVLSAKNKERLQEQAERLLAAIEEEQFSESNLADIAYTLQVGREAMEERMGVIVGSIPELIEKLEAFATGQDRNDELYMGEVKRNKDTLSVLAADEEMQETIAKWFERGKYAKLLNLWVKGLNFDWNKLYGEVKPRRISLPTYPFARERYWIPETDSPSASRKASQVISAVLHPLLHQNTSNLSEQRFSSTFTGQEFFLKDHIVQGQNMLPGVAYLEMARAAIEQATDGLIEEPGRIKLKNVIWARPITVKDRPVQVHIGIYPEESGEIAYEIYTRPESKEEEPVIYSQGNAILQPVTEAPSLDLAVLQAQCSQKRLSPGQCYDKYEEMGIIYGPGHRGIEEVYIGADQALARLSLPFSVLNTQNQYVLHPSLMDAALQSSIGLMIGSGDADDSLEASVPFALQEMEVLGPCTSKMWALLRYSDGRKTSAKGLKMDIDICDENGTVCVRMRGFSSRDLESAEEDSVVSGGNIGTLLLRPDWQEYPVTVEGVFEYTDHLVIISELSKISRRNLEKQMKGVRCLTLVSGQDNIEGRFNDYVIQTFEEIQTILKNKAGGKVLVQVVVSGEEEQQMLTGLTGLLKTAQSENPKLIGQVIEIEAGESLEGIIAKLKENSQSPSDNQIRYQDGKRYILGWNEIEDVRENEEIPWKDRGVYLITGGAGGLGMIFAGDIAGKVKDATLILTGRSKLNQDKEAQINEIEALGARVEYRRVDISDQKAVIDLMKHIRERFGTLDGILHSAGVIRDNYIIKKTKEEIEEVLASKVNGLVNLDQASRDMDLDFFILFSSVAGALGNLGQADYAAANAFMDAYAGYRNNLAALQQRQGKTLSVNWPLWKESGMKVDAETEEMLMQTMGIIAMESSAGIRALYQGLSLCKDQLMVMNGDLKQIRKMTSRQAPVTRIPVAKPDDNKALPFIKQDILRIKTENYLKNLLSSIIKLPGYRIEADVPMEKYGIDSLMVTKMTNQLEIIFGSLPKTLLFEYLNIRDLAGYFIDNYTEQLTELLGIKAKDGASGETEAAATEPKTVKASQASGRRSRFMPTYTKTEPEKVSGVTDVAIIGVAGRYPEAENMGELWDLLQEGRDCIVEVPKDRWDHSLYYDENRNVTGKTYCKWGSFLKDVDKFDPLFFNISPREAIVMNPQERLLMQTVWNLLESSGYTRKDLQDQCQSRVGFYVGAMFHQYQSFSADVAKAAEISIDSYSAIANRISFFFNLQGPSIAVDTMCSSSATAIHMACESLMNGDCLMAIASGVNLTIHPNKYLALSIKEEIGSHFNSRAFADGDGYLPGEGVGAVLLKPLSKAIQDGDDILAVIKSTAVNHGGHTNGYSVPNLSLQAQLFEENFVKAGIDPRTITYVESAANGSDFGDAIEVNALSKAFRRFTSDSQYCAIGSVKSNFGHSEAVSGIAQLSKVILQFQHKKLVPTVVADPMNPNICFDNTPFYLQRELEDWKRPVLTVDGDEREFPRRATVSSFGAGGSNVHIILEEYIPVSEQTVDLTPIDSPQIIILSARSKERLMAIARQILELAGQRKDLRLVDLAYTLQVHREPMEVRLSSVVNDWEELAQTLQVVLQSYEDGTAIVSETPVFMGDLDDDEIKVKTLLPEKVEGNLTQTLMENQDFEKLAFYWTQGGNIPWKSLYTGQKVKRIALPAYPFAKERYWVSDGLEGDYPKALAPPSNEQNRKLNKDNNASQQYIQDYVVQFLSKELDMDPTQIKLNKNIRDYGIHSIVIMKIIRKFEKDFRIKITGREMLENPSVNSLSAYIAAKIGALNKPQIAQFDKTTRNDQKYRRVNEPESEALQKFKQGELTLEEIERLLDEGVIM